MAGKPTYEELERRVKELEGVEFNHKLAMKEQNALQKAYTAMFNSIDEIMYVADLDTYEILYVNKITREAFDKELIGGICYQEFQGLDAPCEFCTNDTILKQKPTPYRWEYHNSKLKKHYTIVDRIIKWIDGRNVRFELAVDITDRKQAEGALRESEERFSTMFEHMSSGVAIYKPIYDGKDFIFTAFNNAAEEITNLSKDDVIGNRLMELFPNMDKSGLLGSLQKAYKTGAPERVPPFYYEDKNRKGWRENRIYTLPTGEVVALFDDVTDRFEAEIKLKESEKKYRSMMEAIKDSAYICSSDLRIEYMNPRMISKIGYDATGENCYKTIYNRDKKCSWCMFDQVQKGDHIDYELASPIDNRYYSVSNSPIYHSNESISKLTIFRDITETKAIETQLNQARKMESIGTLAGGVAHDFNNLLFTIVGNTELCLEDIPQWNPVHENLEEIKTASLRASGIVKQLLNFSRNTDQKLKSIGAVTVIKDGLKFLRSTIPSNIKIVQHLPDIDVQILGDPIQINQILMNICINASQEMEKTGGTIEIKVENICLSEGTLNDYSELDAGEYLKISISDTGSGIALENIDRIFDPYFTTKEVGKGSGMGLAVVHGIIKNHQGAIKVDSQLGDGTLFTILFPVIDAIPVSIVKEKNKLPCGTETILFVDDEVSIVNMLGKTIARLGYKIETKLNPEEALDLFNSDPNNFDLVITDMTMPQMTGAILAEKLKGIRHDIPIIICTGHSALMTEEKAQQLGIDAFVMKPASRLKIAKAIRNVLDK